MKIQCTTFSLIVKYISLSSNISVSATNGNAVQKKKGFETYNETYLDISSLEHSWVVPGSLLAVLVAAES